MYARPAPRGTRPLTAARHASTRLRRLAAALAAVTCGLLASAAAAPAAFASIPYGQSSTAPARQLPATTVRVIASGGMAAWQIALIALGAALAGAAAAVLLSRVRAARRVASATTA